MFGLLRPRAYFDSLTAIDPAELAQRGYRALLFDVDNTITPWNSPEVTPEVLAWFAALPRYQLAGCIISNNSAERLAPLAAKLGIDYLAKARKPLPFGCARAAAQLGAAKEQTLMLGDQLFTDVLGANLAGIDAVLLKPISLAREFRWTYVNRRLEKLLWRPVMRGVPHNRF